MVAQVFIAWKFWALTWDDSAITLGFARTFAQTGKIEPTAGSGIVEGYSTTLWMLLMALAAKVVRSPSVLLAIAKLATLALNILNLYLIRAWFSTWMPKESGALVAGIFGCSFMFYETINGMETPLLLALILSMLLLHGRPGSIARRSYLAAGVAVLLVRWEAAWFLVPFVLLERPMRRALISGLTWVTAFIAMNIVRRVYFGSFLPNTIIAKHGAPYLTGTGREQVLQRLGQLHDLWTGCWYFAAVVFLYVVYRSLRRVPIQPGKSTWGLRFAALFVIFSAVLTVVIGKNWGPVLRSFYSGWAFLFGLLVFPLAHDFSVPVRRRSLSVVVAVLFALSLYRMTRVVHELKATYAPTYMPGATVNKVKVMNDVLAKVQGATGHHDLLFAGPDMGAVLLYSKGVRVIDLGLLCNKVLARERYGAIESYVLQQQRPDVMDVHGMWIGLTGVKTSSRFHAEYEPMAVNGKRVFIRRDLVSLIAPARLREARFVPGDGYATNSSETGIDAADEALNESFGQYLILN